MAEKLLIAMVNSNPRDARQLAPPLSQAIVAAAMEFDVEMIFTSGCGEVLQQGMAKDIPVDREGTRTIYDMIQEAHGAGVKFKICSSALEAWGDNLIAEVEETVGAAYLISEAMDDSTVVFTY